MVTNKETRLWNARYLVAQAGTIAAFSNAIGKAQAQVGQFVGVNPVKGIGSNIARQIESAFDKTEGWLDTPHPLGWSKIEKPEWKEQQLELMARIENDRGELKDDYIKEAFEGYLQGEGQLTAPDHAGNAKVNSSLNTNEDPEGAKLLDEIALLYYSKKINKSDLQAALHLFLSKK